MFKGWTHDFLKWTSENFMPAPSFLTDDVKDDLLLACRYGDLEDVQTFVTEHGPETLNEIHDNNGNCVLHMVCANGHTGKRHPTC